MLISGLIFTGGCNSTPLIGDLVDVVRGPASSQESIQIPVAKEETLEIYSVSPDVGELDGGTEIRIYGSGFQSGAAVRVGDARCADVQLKTASILTCKTPGARQIALVDIEVLNADGTYGQLDYAFSYVEGTAQIQVSDDNT